MATSNLAAAGVSVKAVLYARFSPRRNSDECQSNEKQLLNCREYCEGRGYQVLGEYEDVALSGDDEDRRGLWDAVEALPRGGVLVVYRQDRLARSVYLEEYIRRCVAKNGGTIEVVSGTRNGTSPEEVFIRQVMSAYAEMEKRIIAARTKAAMVRHQKNGRLMSKIPPFGTRQGVDRVVDGRVEKTIVVDRVEVATISAIKRLRELGASYRGIATQLSATGVLCRGLPWNHQTVRRICQRV